LDTATSALSLFQRAKIPYRYFLANRVFQYFAFGLQDAANRSDARFLKEHLKSGGHAVNNPENNTEYAKDLPFLFS